MTDKKIETAPKNNRLFSVDALRGFSMFWILGADTLAHLLARLYPSPVLNTISDQLKHADWAGFHAYDLIFPLFMFLSGVSVGLSLHNNPVTATAKPRLIKKAVKRCLILILLGIIYNFGWDVSPERFRIASVLGQIGLAYLGAFLLFIHVHSWAWRTAVLVALLTIIALIQNYIPVPGIGAGILTPEGSINGWIDRNFLPGRLYVGSYDPEGILNIISATNMTIFGALAGSFLAARPEKQTFSGILYIAAVGGILLLSGYALHESYPIIKAAWTTPFSLVSAGYSSLLLAVFYGLFDQLKLRKAGFFLSVIGMNSIGIYMAARFFAYPLFALTAETGPVGPALGIPLVIFVILLEWLALYYCYRKRWFLKV